MASLPVLRGHLTGLIPLAENRHGGWNFETNLGKYQKDKQISLQLEKQANFTSTRNLKDLPSTPGANGGVVECGEYEELASFYNWAANELCDLCQSLNL